MRLAVLLAFGWVAGCSYDFESFTPNGEADSEVVADTASSDSSNTPDTPDTLAPADSDAPDTESDGALLDTDLLDTALLDTALGDTGAADTAVTDTAIVDTGAPVTCTEADGKLFGGHCYFSLPAETGTASKAACEGRGAHLVTITSLAEETFVEAIRAGRDRWIGLRRPPGSSPVEASFGWVTTEPVSYKKWGAGEPNGSGECVLLRTADTWSDQDCKSSKDVICERE